MNLVFSVLADAQLRELPTQISNRIVLKLEWYAAQLQPLHFAKPLTGMSGQFRFRIGEYRAIVLPDGTVLSVLRIQKRSEAYRKK